MAPMTPDQVIQHYGSQAAAARKLQMSRAIVSHWLKTNRISPNTQTVIQVRSGNKLKADAA